MGAFVCKERVERNGFLIAYAGEIMSEDEAARRGLIPAEQPAEQVKPAPKPTARKSQPKTQAKKPRTAAASKAKTEGIAE